MTLKRKYNQTKDKKKKCPRCQNYVFNATIICTGLLKNNIRCNFIHRNKKICEKERETINNKLKLNEIKTKRQYTPRKNTNGYFVTKAVFKNNIKFLIETNNIKKNLFKKDCENIFINLKEIINI
jgi:hypothetical protein|tara:strand:+ start:412 stop:786 length:375 start_codon:yes stop_codon:yes gene_type:complete